MGKAAEGEKCDARLIGKHEQLPVTSPFLLGRSTGNDVVLPDADVSRRHAMIFEYGGHWWVTDMGSRNGVHVNGTRIHHARPLRDHDQLRVGSHTFTFSATDVPRSSVGGREPMTEVAMDAKASPSPGSIVCELVVASAQGEILEGEKAANWFFGRKLEHPRGAAHSLLPAAVRRWLAKLADNARTVGAALELQEKERRIVVTLSRRHEDRFYLLLREESALIAIERLRTLGLTEREAEVMHWVCEGNKNPEIAAILEVSVHTVNRHIEHILKKLGVDNRQKAIVSVMERLAA